MARPLRFAAVVLLFALGAPLVVATGLFVLVKLGVVPMGHGFINPKGQVEEFLLIAVVCFFLGFLPGVFTGLVASVLSPRLKGLAAWLGACAAIGAVATLAGAFLAGQGGDFTEVGSFWWVFALSGAGGAAVCALAAERFRPRAVEPDWNPRPSGSG